MNHNIFGRNRLLGFFLGLFSTVVWWYTILLLTQEKIVIRYRHYVGLVLGILGYTLWFLKFSYLVESS